jgi:hypothetical protein
MGEAISAVLPVRSNVSIGIYILNQRDMVAAMGTLIAAIRGCVFYVCIQAT